MIATITSLVATPSRWEVRTVTSRVAIRETRKSIEPPNGQPLLARHSADRTMRDRAPATSGQGTL